MIRSISLMVLAAALTLAAAPCSAQSDVRPHAVRKALKPRKALAPTPAPAIGGINTPSTDFSKVERADEEPSGPNGPTFRPTMGAGGMGLGGAF